MDKSNQVQQSAQTTWHRTSGSIGPRRMWPEARKNRCNSLILFIAILSLWGLASCSGRHNTLQEPISTEQASIDSPAVALHEIDSIMNSGRLVHLDVYEIGRLKNISISVQKLTAGEEATVWINFRKDCGGEYKQNSTVTLNDKDAEDLKILIQNAQSKIRAIQ